MLKRERIEEEFEISSQEEGFKEYSYITSIISVTYNLIADELSKLANFQKGTGLDIGAGLGDLAIEIARRYPQLVIIGVDISQKAIEEAGKKAKNNNIENVRFEFANAHNLPFKDMTFDLIVSHGSIHHWKDPEKAFREIFRLLKPAGLAYLTDLKRDAPRDIVKEVAVNLPPAQAKAFIHSVNASFTHEELNQMLNKIRIEDFSICEQRFSKETILKNKNILRNAPMRNVNYNKLSQSIVIKK
jgi:ubiquinone/menaquinone biosynthesis C-methylase UbiE